jgi:hypothetical protein
MTRKIKLGWRKPNNISLCKGEIVSKKSYNDYLILWTKYEGMTRTYLIHNGNTFLVLKYIPFHTIKEYLSGDMRKKGKTITWKNKIRVVGST